MEWTMWTDFALDIIRVLVAPAAALLGIYLGARWQHRRDILSVARGYAADFYMATEDAYKVTKETVETLTSMGEERAAGAASKLDYTSFMEQGGERVRAIVAQWTRSELLFKLTLRDDDIIASVDRVDSALVDFSNQIPPLKQWAVGTQDSPPPIEPIEEAGAATQREIRRLQKHLVSRLAVRL